MIGGFERGGEDTRDQDQYRQGGEVLPHKIRELVEASTLLSPEHHTFSVGTEHSLRVGRPDHRQKEKHIPDAAGRLPSGNNTTVRKLEHGGISDALVSALTDPIVVDSKRWPMSIPAILTKATSFKMAGQSRVHCTKARTHTHRVCCQNPEVSRAYEKAPAIQNGRDMRN